MEAGAQVGMELPCRKLCVFPENIGRRGQWAERSLPVALVLLSDLISGIVELPEITARGSVVDRKRVYR